MSLSLRYSRGEYDAVWQTFMTRLSDEPAFVDDPDCAALTFAMMTRMRRNVDVIIDRLRRADYRFAVEEPRVAASDKSLNALRKACAPFTVIAFAEIIGKVDLRAAHGDGQVADGLGRYDPMVFDPDFFSEDFADKDWRASQEAETPGQMQCVFAPDAFHKANVSGGESYNFIIPSPDADPVVRPLGLPFLVFMRGTIAQGGFWGISEPIFEAADWDNVPEIEKGRRLPDCALLQDIRVALQPF